ncbi:hypothetical protein C6560_01815 [Enterobacter sp. FS01]|nr:hypothetical protein C6560_01815 [Enterobacter sp. FS01]
MLRYCLFLRSAPHHSEAKISRCTVSVLPVIDTGATRLHVKPNRVYVNKQSNRRARIDPHPDPLPEREREKGQDAANMRGLFPLPCGERVRVRGENYLRR